MLRDKKPSAPTPVRLQWGWAPSPHSPALPGHGFCPAGPTHMPTAQPGLGQSLAPLPQSPDSGEALGWALHACPACSTRGVPGTFGNALFRQKIISCISCIQVPTEALLTSKFINRVRTQAWTLEHNSSTVKLPRSLYDSTQSPYQCPATVLGKAKGRRLMLPPTNSTDNTTFEEWEQQEYSLAMLNYTKKAYFI